MNARLLALLRLRGYLGVSDDPRAVDAAIDKLVDELEMRDRQDTEHPLDPRTRGRKG